MTRRKNLRKAVLRYKAFFFGRDDLLISRKNEKFRDVGSNLGSEFLNVAIHQWISPNVNGETTCARAMSYPLPLGAQCYWGQALSEDAFTGQLIPVPQPYCSGKRRCSKRMFVNGEPPFLFVPLDTFARDGIINDVSQLPEQVQLAQRRYTLGGLTFWSPHGHYRGAVAISGQWHYYDGLWERQQRGTGLKKCSSPSTPKGYMLSHAVFVASNL